MKYNPDIHHRQSIRLKDFDYSSDGSYYITICTQDRINLFGEVFVGADLVSARVKLNHAGKMIERIYEDTIFSFDDVITDKYIIMPNHFHCILSLQRADTRSAPTKTKMDTVIQEFKSKSTVEYINGVKSGIYPPFNKRIWQRNYYEHIIRDKNDYEQKWQYIDENPVKWNEDDYYQK